MARLRKEHLSRVGDEDVVSGGGNELLFGALCHGSDEYAGFLSLVRGPLC